METTFPFLTNSEEMAMLNMSSTEVQLLANIVERDLMGDSINVLNSDETEFYDKLPKTETFSYRPQPSVINTEDYTGPYDFEVLMTSPKNRNSAYVYSTRLKKLFIQMSSMFPLDFKWTGNFHDFYVRATPLYAQPQYSQEVVNRCITHAQPTEKSNLDVPPCMWDHIIRCQDANSLYFGSKEANEHLSVVTQLGLPQNGADTVRKLYAFHCKNSCATGMNRRAVHVVYTLEDSSGEILGRRTINVRVCSCPKRDCEKEEREHIKKFGDSFDIPPPGKKRKLPKDKTLQSSVEFDNKAVKLALKLPNKKIATDIIQYAYKTVASEAYLTDDKSRLQPYLEEIEKLLKSVGE